MFVSLCVLLAGLALYAAVTATSSLTVSCLGKQFTNNVSVDADNGALTDKTLAAAKTGTLTTRTDANTGTLTMTSGHGITTGAKIDLYWSGGSRRGVTVGTVATNSVPIDLGSGDDLPAAATAVTAMVVNEETSTWTLTGNNLTQLICGCNKPFTVVLLDGSDAELFAFVSTSPTGGCYFWESTSGVTNPLAGDTVAKVRTSHGDSTSSRSVVCIAGLN